MTVCTASMFYWNSGVDGEDRWGPAFVIASDRMLTDVGLEIEYEASRPKAQTCDGTHMIFVAGDMPFVTEAVVMANRALGNDGGHATVEIARVLGAAFEKVRRSRAAKRYLAPLNLTEDMFEAGLLGHSNGLMMDLADKMQAAHFDAEAMVVGVDGDVAGLFRIDPYGVVTDHFHIGFLSIGIGGIHSSAQFMNEPYLHSRNYYSSLYSTFVAKKRAEVAPGVGKVTDIFRITRDSVVQIPDPLVRRLEKLHQAQRISDARVTQRAAQKIIQEEQKFFASQGEIKGK